MTEPQFDVFLCHNSEDKPAVMAIAQQLRHNSLKPWLDVWELQPGGIWQFTLEQQIESIGAAAVFVGKQGLGPWQSEEIYAFLQEFIRRKCPVIPVMLPDAPQQPRLPIFLRNRHWVDFRLQEPDPLVQLIWGITGQRPDNLSQTAEAISIQNPGQVEPPEENEELAALRRELELLKAQQTLSSEITSAAKPENRVDSSASDDELATEKGVDYTRLQTLLKAQNFKDAHMKPIYECWKR